MKYRELKQKLNNNEPLLLIDIREPDEYEDGVTKSQFTNIPMGKMFTEAKKGNLDSEKIMVLVCATGARSEIVARELNQKGFMIEVLEGGITAITNK